VGISLVVDIAVQHYADHLPFHRLATRCAGDGLSIDRATLCRVATHVADAVQLVVNAMEKALLSSDTVVGIDGTGIKILNPSRCRRRAVYVLHGHGHVVYRMLQAEDANTVLEGFGAFRGVVVVSDAAKLQTGDGERAHGPRHRTLQRPRVPVVLRDPRDRPRARRVRPEQRERAPAAARGGRARGVGVPRDL